MPTVQNDLTEQLVSKDAGKFRLAEEPCPCNMSMSVIDRIQQ